MESRNHQHGRSDLIQTFVQSDQCWLSLVTQGGDRVSLSVVIELD